MPQKLKEIFFYLLFIAKILLAFQFVKTVILQLIEIFDFTVYFKIFKKFLIS